MDASSFCAAVRLRFPAQARHELEASVPAVLEVHVRRHPRGRVQGQVHVEGETHEVSAEARLRDAHEGEGSAVDANGLAQHIAPPTEALLPERLGDDQDRLRPGGVVLPPDQPAALRTRPEQGEETAGNELTADDPGGRFVPYREPAAHERLDSAERTGLLAEVPEGRARKAGEAVELAVLGDVHGGQAGGLDSREGPQQQRVDHAEEPGGDAHGEAEGQDDGQGERGLAKEGAGGQAKLAHGTPRSNPRARSGALVQVQATKGPRHPRAAWKRAERVAGPNNLRPIADGRAPGGSRSTLRTGRLDGQKKSWTGPPSLAYTPIDIDRRVRWPPRSWTC